MKHVTMQPNRHIASSRTSGKVTTVRLPTNREMRWRQIHSVRTSAKPIRTAVKTDVPGRISKATPIRSGLGDGVTNSTMGRTTTRSLQIAGKAAVLVPLALVAALVGGCGRSAEAKKLDESFLTSAAAGDKSSALHYLARGAEINTKDVYGKTALHFFAEGGNWEMVKFLLMEDADVHARDQKGRTPIHLAAAYGDGSMERLLLSYDADPLARDNDGKTAIHYRKKYLVGVRGQILESQVRAELVGALAKQEASSTTSPKKRKEIGELIERHKTESSKIAAAYKDLNEEIVGLSPFLTMTEVAQLELELVQQKRDTIYLVCTTWLLDSVQDGLLHSVNVLEGKTRLNESVLDSGGRAMDIGKEMMQRKLSALDARISELKNDLAANGISVAPSESAKENTKTESPESSVSRHPHEKEWMRAVEKRENTKYQLHLARKSLEGLQAGGGTGKNVRKMKKKLTAEIRQLEKDVSVAGRGLSRIEDQRGWGP